MKKVVKDLEARIFEMENWLNNVQAMVMRDKAYQDVYKIKRLDDKKVDIGNII